MLDALRSDARQAWGQLRRSPLRGLVAVLTLGVGLGLAGTALSLVRSLETLPAPGIPRDDALVRIRGIATRAGSDQPFGRSLSMPEIAALTDQHRVFARVGAWTSEHAPIATAGGAAGVLAGVSYVSDAFFPTLRVPFTLGRAPRTLGEVALSHVYWRSRLGGDSTALGRLLWVDGHAVTIVGITGARFRGPDAGDTVTAWLPLRARAQYHPGSAGALLSPDSALFSVVGRLADGVTLPQATAVAQLVAQRVNRSDPNSQRVPGSEVVRLLAANATPVVGTSAALGAVSAIVLLVILVVCVTVSTLLAGAAVARGREIAVRLALGASRGRIIRLLLLESVLLATAGSAAGALLAGVAWRFAGSAFAPARLIFDWTTVAGCFGLVAMVGVLSGLVPALHASRASIGAVLQGAGTTTGPRARLILQRRLVVLQVALTQPLLLGLAVLLQVVTAEARSAGTTPGADHTVVVEFDRIGATLSRAARSAQLRRAVERIAALPGVTAVASQPAGFQGGRFQDVGAPGAVEFTARVQEIDTGFFPMMAARMLRGRGFTAGDSAVMLVGSELARDAWGAANPVGRRVQLEGGGPSYTIVGVVDASGTPAAEGGIARKVYLPVSPTRPDMGIWHSVYARTSIPAAGLVTATSAALRAEMPSVTVTAATTLEATEREAQRRRLRTAGAALAAGVIALLLASVGLFATGALAVVQRTREIGIRAALGARPSRLVGAFFAQGARLAATGLVLGLPLSVAALRWFVPIHTVPTVTPVLATACGVSIITALACYVPAARVGRANPVIALRHE